MAQDDIHKQTAGHSVICPTCRNLISYVDFPRSNHFGCNNCLSYFKFSVTGNHSVLRTFNADNKGKPNFPFGTAFRKKSFLVSYVRKRDPKEDFYWDEYLFYHPEFDYYITLADLDGYWMMIYLNEVQDQYNITKNTTSYYDNPFLSYQFELVYAEGEFNWDIAGDEQLVTNEYVTGATVMVNETGLGKSEWYKAYFMTPVEVAESLDIPMELLSPRKYFNPATFYPSWRVLWKFSLFVLVVFMAVWMSLNTLKPEKTIYSNSFKCKSDTGAWGGTLPSVSSSFDVDSRGMLTLKLHAPGLDNNWMELETSLVNDKTGEEYEATKALEYYHGYDGGESWTEGGNSEQLYFSGVSPGTYHLNIYPFLPENSTKNSEGVYDLGYDVVVTENSSMPGNFMTTVFLIFLYPIIQYFRKYNFESKARNIKIYGE